MAILRFLQDNARWISGGFLLTYVSSFGQTFFISLSAGEIRSEFALSHGDFGIVYMIATLASALTLPHLGKIVDHVSVTTTVLLAMPALALGCLIMALGHHIVFLVLAIYLLRLFGQGMMNHIALTAMGKWFSAQRGRAVSVSAIGVNFGEATLPLVFVVAAGAMGWRNTWLLAALAIVVFLPVIARLMRTERQPRNNDPVAMARKGADWTRAEVLGDPLFYLMLAGVMAPPFIGTTIFFHQVYLVELRGWSGEAFAASFAVMSVTTIVFSLIAGALVDLFSAVRLLPSFLLPLGAACLVLANVPAQWAAFAFMALLGVSYGFSSTLFGALWPEVYGTRHLGAIRSLIVSIMVFQTAAGPGVTGYLIDHGVAYPLQIGVMGLYCAVAAVAMVIVSGKLNRRRAQADA
jgi:MFS family permease